MRGPARGEKPLYWVGSTKRDLLAFPEAIKDGIGTALSIAQFGGKHPAAKPWKGAGSGVLEVVEDHGPSVSVGPYTCCTAFRRSRIEAFRHRNRTWNSFYNA